MKKLHALLIGINNYNNPKIKNLFGCENDVQNIKKLLSSGFYETMKPKITVLLNEQATHDNIIQTFRTVLRDKVETGDTAFFMFSGHGSRQLTAPEFQQFVSEPYDETLVCYDSRNQNGLDLADKELSVLLHEISLKGANSIVMLDSCHSGSGTRKIEDEKSPLSTRQTDFNVQRRNLETYINGWYLEQYATNKINIPRSKHILLSACDQRELAKESPEKTGIFTNTLLQVLNETPLISFAELLTKVRRTILKYNIDQTPQIEPYEGFNPYAAFLTCENITEQPILTVTYSPVFRKWEVNIGAFNGLPTLPEKPSKFEIYEKKSNKFIGNVETTSVMPLISYLEMNNLHYNTNNEYFAKLISLPENPLIVKIIGNSNLVPEFQKHFSNNFQIEFSTNIPASIYEIEIKDEEISLYTNFPVKSLIQKTYDSKTNSILHLVGILHKIINWERAISLKNKNSKIYAHMTDFDLFDENDKFINHYEGIYRFDYKDKNIKIQIKAKKNITDELYFNLVYFSTEFGICIIESNKLITEKEYITLFGIGDEQYFHLPPHKQFCIDTFRLFISTKPFDSFILAQEQVRDYGGTIKTITRDASGTNNRSLLKPDDWTVKTIEIYLQKIN